MKFIWFIVGSLLIALSAAKVIGVLAALTGLWVPKADVTFRFALQNLVGFGCLLYLGVRCWQRGRKVNCAKTGEQEAGRPGGTANAPRSSADVDVPPGSA